MSILITAAGDNKDYAIDNAVMIAVKLGVIDHCIKRAQDIYVEIICRTDTGGIASRVIPVRNGTGERYLAIGNFRKVFTNRSGRPDIGGKEKLLQNFP